MTDLLIRNLDPGVIKRLKSRAKEHHRSLQGEVKYIIEGATKLTMNEAKKVSDAWHKKLQDGSHTDSTEILREDRNR